MDGCAIAEPAEHQAADFLARGAHHLVVDLLLLCGRQLFAARHRHAWSTHADDHSAARRHARLDRVAFSRVIAVESHRAGHVDHRAVGRFRPEVLVGQIDEQFEIAGHLKVADVALSRGLDAERSSACPASCRRSPCARQRAPRRPLSPVARRRYRSGQAVERPTWSPLRSQHTHRLLKSARMGDAGMSAEAAFEPCAKAGALPWVNG